MKRPHVVLGRGCLSETICLSEYPAGRDRDDTSGRSALNGSGARNFGHIIYDGVGCSLQALQIKPAVERAFKVKNMDTLAESEQQVMGNGDLKRDQTLEWVMEIGLPIPWF